MGKVYLEKSTENSQELSLYVFQREISDRFDGLSRQLKKVACFMMSHTEEVALETITTLARRIGVQPSCIVRFAQTFGFRGYSDLQKLFKDHLMMDIPSYRERISAFQMPKSNKEYLSALHNCVDEGIEDLSYLKSYTSQEAIEEAVLLMNNCETIYLLGNDRSFPVVFYMNYALRNLGKKSILIDGIGGMTKSQCRFISQDDMVIVVNFSPCTQDIFDIVLEKSAKNIPVVAITESCLGGISSYAHITFEVRERKDSSFRSLLGPLCLVQSLVISLGERLDAKKAAS